MLDSYYILTRMKPLILPPCLPILFLPIIATYTIESCGNSEPSIEYALTLARTSMIHPLFDIERGRSSTHGYNALYKSEVNRPFLDSLMIKIMHLPATQAAGRDREPTLVCAKPDVRQKFDIGYEPLQRCAETGVASFWAIDTALIFLCPRFVTLRAQPVFSPGGPKDIYCPLVRNNVFLGQSSPLVNYQSYDLVHQLAHLYLQREGLNDETVPKEVMDWNGCVGLGWAPSEGGPSVRNPFNLVYYVACKCCPEDMRLF